MPALGLKVALLGGAALLVLLPAFNSLNQVVVDEVDPPFTVEDPPDVQPPPPEPGDQDFDAQPEQGPEQESPQCPPPKPVLAWQYAWDTSPTNFLSGGGRGRFAVEPGAVSLAWSGNLSNFVGQTSITLTDQNGATQEIFAYDSAAADPEDPQGSGVGNRQFVDELRGAAPGPWEATVAIRPLSTGHLDIQIYKVFPCGGVGRA